ncbi:hypothetical protein B0H14DRAFT_2638197 [Mycena olivaceomarginata]|nr:hypothetical protein B0H14DRAFT_2638197 [Mycena olivaceomarginata]
MCAALTIASLETPLLQHIAGQSFVLDLMSSSSNASSSEAIPDVDEWEIVAAHRTGNFSASLDEKPIYIRGISQSSFPFDSSKSRLPRRQRSVQGKITARRLRKIDGKESGQKIYHVNKKQWTSLHLELREDCVAHRLEGNLMNYATGGINSVKLRNILRNNRIMAIGGEGVGGWKRRETHLFTTLLIELKYISNQWTTNPLPRGWIAERERAGEGAAMENQGWRHEKKKKSERKVEKLNQPICGARTLKRRRSILRIAWTAKNRRSYSQQEDQRKEGCSDRGEPQIDIQERAQQSSVEGSKVPHRRKESITELNEKSGRKISDAGDSSARFSLSRMFRENYVASRPDVSCHVSNEKAVLESTTPSQNGSQKHRFKVLSQATTDNKCPGQAAWASKAGLRITLVATVIPLHTPSHAPSAREFPRA